MSRSSRFTLATIVGARPQFVKAAPFSRVWRQHQREILIHTGQHYDPEMSAVFFRELGIPRPDFNLGIRGGGAIRPTARMMGLLENILLKIKPDGVLVYGDTDSTLAGALSAAKLHIPIFHVEAGLRSFLRSMPEEVNRVVVDHLSDLLFAPTATAVHNLSQEGIRQGVYQVGDLMLDAFNHYQLRLRKSQGKDPARSPYALVTLHRADNTNNRSTLLSLCKAISTLPLPVVWPLHPRTRNALRDGRIRLGKNITTIDPVSYLKCIHLQSRAEVILTDSGGVQKEAYFLHKPCVILRRETEWTELLKTGHNALGGVEERTILAAFHQVLSKNRSVWPALFGQGNASLKIASIIFARLNQTRIRSL